MPVTIQNVTPGSPAARKRIRPGETLLRINGHVIEDVLDYRFYLNRPAGGGDRREKGPGGAYP